MFWSFFVGLGFQREFSKISLLKGLTSFRLRALRKGAKKNRDKVSDGMWCVNCLNRGLARILQISRMLRVFGSEALSRVGGMLFTLKDFSR